MGLQLPLFRDEVKLVHEGRGERARLESKYAPRMHFVPNWGKMVSYVGNKDVPGLRLYRYKEAFSYALVRHFLEYYKDDLPTTVVLDPFMGMGTTVYAAMRLGFHGVGVDKLPVAVAIAQGLTALPSLQPGSLMATFLTLKERVEEAKPAPIADDVPIIQRAFQEDIKVRLQKWKRVLETLTSPLREVFWLLFLSILEPCSQTTKDGQFLRLRPQKAVRYPDDILQEQVARAEEDLRMLQDAQRRERWGPAPVLIEGDARFLSSLSLPGPAGLIVTSPPYANRYDYTRTYSLELCFGFVKNFEELKTLRHSILRSHIESRLDADQEAPPHLAVREIEEALREKKLNNPRIPIMLRAYFIDMARVIREMYQALAPGGRSVMVVDNVRFEGEHVPVDLILNDLAEQEGFQVEGVWVARFKGNSSQQMKKYGRHPVRESVLLWRKPV